MPRRSARARIDRRRLLPARSRARSRPPRSSGGRTASSRSSATGLREISHGRWEGLTRHEVETRYPDEYTAWESDPFTFAPESGESGVAVLARALPVIREIVVRHAGTNVLVVSHKATLRLLLSSLLGFDARGYRDRLDQSPACLNVVDFKDPGARPPDAVQRHLALSGPAAPRARQPVEVVGRSGWRQEVTRRWPRSGCATCRSGPAIC